MSGHVYSFVYLLIFCVLFVSVVFTMRYGLGTIVEVRPKHDSWATLVAPLIFLFPTRLLTEAGARRRLRFFVALLLAACCFGTLNALERAYGKPPYMQALE